MKREINEIRTTTRGLHIVSSAEEREAGNIEDSRLVEGYAIVFNEKSQVLDDWEGEFREIIDPLACTQGYLNEQDVKMTLFHNRESLLARCNKGKGSMRLSVDETGVKFQFEAPRTADGEKCLEGVKRGDLNGCSFTFVPDWKTAEQGVDEETGLPLIRHKSFRWMGEMTIGSDPAYLQTSVNAREMFHKEEPEADESRLKAEAEAEAERKREMEEAETKENARKREKMLNNMAREIEIMKLTSNNL